ncbi:MAG: prepilin-type N-terminal cleavage/methylation domain-containing protein [Proteobacteria bacterium]|nr:prepilin-type N-terminal cleavage/methylation domain-containing protein [Pseudomonadota bacterium]
MKYSIQGFTLIELAMVLLILGLLMSSFLAPLAARVEQQERNNTQIQLDEIEEILYGHVLQNAYLPCPDCTSTAGGCAAATANDGVEDTVVAGGGLTCATEVGNLPWVTLGVKSTDEWNNIFTYRVDDTFADRNNATTDGTGCAASATLNVSFSLCSDGEIIVLNSAGGTNLATNIPAIVVSHGKNFSLGAPTANETENLNNDTTFVDTNFSNNAITGFDDMVIWISPHVLRTMSVKAGILP